MPPKNVLGSPRTAASGWSVIVIVVLDAVRAIIDGDPATNPDWLMLFGILAAGVGQVFSADHKTVEKVIEHSNINSASLGNPQIEKDASNP